MELHSLETRPYWKPELKLFLLAGLQSVYVTATL